MTELTSLWDTVPDYVINMDPCSATVRVSLGDTALGNTVLAESTQALIVTEQDHAARIYIPSADVDFTHLTQTDHHSVCPFKGKAAYWTISVGDQTLENAVWSYPETFEQVKGLTGYLCFYDDKVNVELLEQWPASEPGNAVSNRFPTWGDASDLLRLIDVVPTTDGQFEGPTYHDLSRNVVEGGQMLAQAIVAAAKTEPDKRVISASMLFSKAAAFDKTLDVAVDVVRGGRQFSTIEVRTSQDDKLRSLGQVMLDAGPSGPDLVHGQIDMPDVDGPAKAKPFDMWMTGRDVRVVDGAYDPDPDRVGPPVIYTWCRFRDSPAESYLHTALMAQSTTHWTFAAAARPHKGVGESMVHTTLSAGMMGVNLTLHDEVDVSEWLLYANPRVNASRGLAFSQCQIFTESGHHVASYSVQAMIRSFDFDPNGRGLDGSVAM